MRKCTRALGLAVSVLVFGCGTAPRKFDPKSPIEVRSGGLGNTYAQGGEVLDHRDMLDKLGEEPQTASQISGAKTLGTIAMVGATVGGALVGWPLGQAAAGRTDPEWALAAVGGGVILVSLPLAFWGDSKVSDAVMTHNASFGESETSR